MSIAYYIRVPGKQASKQSSLLPPNVQDRPCVVIVLQDSSPMDIGLVSPEDRATIGYNHTVLSPSEDSTHGKLEGYMG